MTLFQQDSALAHRAAHVQQLNCCIKKCQTFLRLTSGLQTAQISVVWITRSGLPCSIVSITDKSIVWMNWNGDSSMSAVVLKSIFEEATDQWRGRHRTCVHAKGGNFVLSLWMTMLILSISVTFSVTCLGGQHGGLFFSGSRLSFTFIYTCIFFSWQINSVAAVWLLHL